jgi:hypothetical protein
MKDGPLAGVLECTPEALQRVALCRWPDDQGARFQEHVRQIASFASCNADRLVQILREVGALVSLGQGESGQATSGLLLAARDRRETRRRSGRGKKKPESEE